MDALSGRAGLTAPLTQTNKDECSKKPAVQTVQVTPGCSSAESTPTTSALIERNIEVLGAMAISESSEQLPVTLSTHIGVWDALLNLMGVKTGVRPLGEGAWSYVYYGQSRDGGHLAIKVIKDENKHHRYLTPHETKYDVAALSLPPHPHLMKNHGILLGSRKQDDQFGLVTHPGQLPTDPDGDLYVAAVVSDFIEGRTLYKQFQQQSGFFQDHIINIALGTAQVLKHLHDHGFAHRDISETNLIYDKEKGVTLLDMGTVTSTLTKAKSYVGVNQLLDEDFDTDGIGTLAYRRFQENGYDAEKLDSWELGCLLVFCLTRGNVRSFESSQKGFRKRSEGQQEWGNARAFAEMSDSDKRIAIKYHLASYLYVDDELIDITVKLLRKSPADRISVSEACSQLQGLKGRLALRVNARTYNQSAF